MIAHRVLHVILLLALAACAPGQQLQHPTTWLGNTFGGGQEWVQSFVEGMYVAGDGTVYSASDWGEAWREFGTYSNGKVVGVPLTHQVPARSGRFPPT